MPGWGAGAEFHAEDPGVLVRLITAPGAGNFVVTAASGWQCQPTSRDGVPIAAGESLGLLLCLGGTEPVHSPVAGSLRGLLALPGERVRNHQPLAWLTIDDDDDGDERQEDVSSVRSTD